MNYILSGEDLKEKYDQIILFCNKFTRAPHVHHDENKYMLYCNETDTALIPSFYQELAISYKTNIETYNETLNQILTNQSQLSDDGDSLVDKYTGYVISKRSFDITEKPNRKLKPMILGCKVRLSFP